jgi:hypothetical protein
MSYCRFQNTLSDFRDCKQAMERIIDGEDEPLPRDELQAATQLAAEALSFLKLIYEARAVDFDEIEEHHLVILVEAINNKR